MFSAIIHPVRKFTQAIRTESRWRMIKFIMLAVVAAAFASSAEAQTGPAKTQKPTPQQKIESVLPAQPPQASTGTKPSMEGVKASEFKPPPPKMKTVDVPAPGTPNFPQRAPNNPPLKNPLNK